MKHTDDKNTDDIVQDAEQVSALYQALQQETPSAELDAKILRAARQEAGNASFNKVQKRIPYQAYSIAASICLSVLVVSLFLRNGDELTGSGLEATSIPLSDSPAMERLQQVEAGGDDATEEIIVTAGRAGSGATEAQAEFQANQNRLSLPQQASQLPEAGEAAEDSDAAVFSLALQQDAAQEPGDLQQAPDYRSSADAWLAEIRRLLDAGDEPQAAEERRLFAEAWPDIDIDAALAQSQSQSQTETEN